MNVESFFLFFNRLRRSNGEMLGAGLDKVDRCWAPNGRGRNFHPLRGKYVKKPVENETLSSFLCRTLPGKHLEEIANQFRTHNINALLVIGGFEVCLIIFTSSLFSRQSIVMITFVVVCASIVDLSELYRR